MNKQIYVVCKVFTMLLIPLNLLAGSVNSGSAEPGEYDINLFPSLQGFGLQRHLRSCIDSHIFFQRLGN
jgi:hypothetical protein